MQLHRVSVSACTRGLEMSSNSILQTERRKAEVNYAGASELESDEKSVRMETSAELPKLH